MHITRIENLKVQTHRYVTLDAVKPLHTAWKCWAVSETNANDQKDSGNNQSRFPQ